MIEPLDDAIRQRFQRQGRRDTDAELRLRRAAHAAGLRYLVDARVPVPGCRSRADMLFRGPQIAVFVDGCFWHRCPIHGTLPVHNRDWWRVKLDGNVARDQRVDRLLSEHGWLALRFWEHEPTDQALALLRAAIAERAPR